jgi:hypothetical protein
MQVNSIGTASFRPAGGVSPFAKLKQSFEKVGSALDSGNLTDAKQALTQLQKDAPPQAGKGDNPLSAKMETLSKALDAGDLKAAQAAYADIKKTISQGPPAGGRPAGMPGGGPPAGGAGKTSGAGSSSSSNKTYDKKDTNKDGTVSTMEEIAYDLKNPGDVAKTSTTAKININGGSIDTIA